MGERLSPGVIIIDEEKRQTIRQARLNDPEKAAGKIAKSLREGVLPSFARGIHNDHEVLDDVLKNRIRQGVPLAFVGFWGVGGKEGLDHNDYRLLSYLGELRQAVETVYPQGAEIQLILADEHGRFNGYPEEEVNSYLGAVEGEGALKGMNSVRLSELYRQWRIVRPDSREPIEYNSRAYQVFWGDPTHPWQGAQLVEAAQRHNRQGVEPLQVAYHYARMRLEEANHLVKTFPEQVLFVNGSKELGKPLLPTQMPHLYLKLGPVWFQKDGIYDAVLKGGTL